MIIIHYNSINIQLLQAMLSEHTGIKYRTPDNRNLKPFDKTDILENIDHRWMDGYDFTSYQQVCTTPWELCKTVVVPYNRDGNHWCLLVYQPLDKVSVIIFSMDL